MRIGVRTTVVLVTSVFAFGWFGSSVEIANGQASGDEAAVRGVVRTLERLFNEGDSNGLGQLYDEEGDRRDAAGRAAKGRRAVQEGYEAGFQTRQPRRALPESQTHWDEGEVRFLRAEVAVVDGFYTLPDRRRGPYTLVVTKENGRWLIAAARAGTAVQPTN
jgi:uncharacterized protein (TIGR02246 family)